MLKFIVSCGAVVLSFVSASTALADPQADKAANAAADRNADKSEREANKAASEKSGNNLVANGDSLTATTERAGPAERFGRQGQLAISGEGALTLSNDSTSGGGSTTDIHLAPAVDYFVIDNLSLGAFILFDYQSNAVGHTTTFGIGPRVGYNFTLSDLVSIWPKVGLSYDTSTLTSDVTTANGVATNVSASTSTSGLALNVFVPIMFHPAPHFFAGFGPFLTTDLSGDPRHTIWGGQLTLGGWVF